MPKIIFEVSAGLYTDLLNFLFKNNIVIYDVKPTEIGFTAICYAKDYKLIAKKARKFQCRIKLKRKKGVYFKFKKYKNRKGLFLGSLIFLILSVSFNSLIWKIEIQTNNEDIKNEVHEILYENNIYAGNFFIKENSLKATQQILLESEDVAFASLNFHKGILSVVIDKIYKKEDYLQDETMYNLSSNMDGEIIDLRVYSGFTTYKVGDIVVKGDILVYTSSEILPPPEKVYIPQGWVYPIVNQKPRAYIVANAQKTYSTSLTLNKEVYLYTLKKEKEVFFRFLDFSFCVNKKKQDFEEYTKITKVYPLDFFGFYLPITIHENTYYQREIKVINTDEKESENILKAQVDTIISQDKSLINLTEKTYYYKTENDKITIYCDVFGEYEITN